MATILQGDALQALQIPSNVQHIQAISVSDVKVVNVTSLDELKKKLMESGCLKPAVLK